MSNVNTIVKKMGNTFQKHSPEILTGIGISGLVTTTVLAVKATPKALELLEREKEHREVDKLTPVETVKVAWKCYIPTAISGTMSILCIVCASSVNARRNAALATAYAISESSLREYKDKVVEVVGEKKEKEIKDAISKDKVNNNPVNNVIITNKGDTLCLEPICNQYFMSNIEDIKKAVNNVNHKMLRHNYVSLNDFYDELGLEFTDVGNQLGWKIYDKGFVDVYFSSQLTHDGTPCIVINYEQTPYYDYDMYF